MILHKKVNLDWLEGGGGVHGGYIFRVASPEALSPETAISSVCTHLTTLIQNYFGVNYEGNKRAENIVKDINWLKELPIVFCKKTEHLIQNTPMYYIQIVLDIPEGKEQLFGNYSNGLSDIGNLLGGLIGTTDGGWMVGNAPINFMYSVGTIKPIVYKGWLGYIPNTDLFWAFKNEVYSAQINLSFVYNVLQDKTIRNRRHMIKYDIHICDNLTEAFNIRTKETYTINSADGTLGTFIFYEYKINHGGTLVKHVLTDQIYLKWIKNVAVFYDGEKALNTSLPYLLKWDISKLKQINVLQYHNPNQFIYCSTYMSIPTLTLSFLRKDTLDVQGRRFSIGSAGFRGTITQIPYNDKKRYFDMALNTNHGVTTGILIMPVDKDESHIKALESCTKIFTAIQNQNSDDFRNACTEYFDTFKPVMEEGNKEDILHRWFKYCTRTTRQQDDQILKAYEKMKKNLEKEYKEIGAYLEHYDFSKCRPIPSIQPDNKLLKNYYKTLQIEPKKVIINSINRKSIKTIEEIKPIVNVLIVKDKSILMNEYPLYNFYNSQNNSLIFDYNKMKGAVIRDKIKNRR